MQQQCCSIAETRCQNYTLINDLLASLNNENLNDEYRKSLKPFYAFSVATKFEPVLAIFFTIISPILTGDFTCVF